MFSCLLPPASEHLEVQVDRLKSKFRCLVLKDFIFKRQEARGKRQENCSGNLFLKRSFKFKKQEARGKKQELVLVELFLNISSLKTTQ